VGFPGPPWGRRGWEREGHGGTFTAESAESAEGASLKSKLEGRVAGFMGQDGEERWRERCGRVCHFPQHAPGVLASLPRLRW
jgi:hypothetical protein